MSTNPLASHNPNFRAGESTAEYCRRMGYTPGTQLVLDQGYGETTLEITAIGERIILAKNITDGGMESTWTLAFHDWKESRHGSNDHDHTY